TIELCSGGSTREPSSLPASENVRKRCSRTSVNDQPVRSNRVEERALQRRDHETSFWAEEAPKARAGNKQIIQARDACCRTQRGRGLCHLWHRPKIQRRSPTGAPALRGRLGAPPCSRAGGGRVPPSGISPRSGRGARSPSPARRRHRQTRRSVPVPPRPPSESAPSTRG